MANKMTIEDLAAMIQNTMASKEDLKQFATKDDLQALRAEMATKDNLKDIVEEMNAMHTDVRYIRSTVGKLVQSDIVQDGTIKDLTARVHRLEQKAGFAK